MAFYWQFLYINILKLALTSESKRGLLKFFHQLMHKWIVLKTILKFTLKLTLEQLQHVSVQLHHHQGAHYSCLRKLQLLK